MKGRTALVTGASRGIGAAVARALAMAGARVVLVARSAGELSALAAELPNGAAPLPADLAQPDATPTVAIAAREILGADPDILVHAAGTFPMTRFENTTDADLERALALNVAAPLRLTRAFLPAMRARRSGHVVMIGSIADRQAFPDNSVYAATKHALRAAHEVLRAETRGSGVRATIISPAATDTPIWDPYDPDGSGHLPSRSDMLRAEDVADAVLWAVTRPPHVDVDELRLSRS
ncbi:MAG: SDR family oxidoreductase [Gemmatimonadaceae bacterium]